MASHVVLEGDFRGDAGSEFSHSLGHKQPLILYVSAKIEGQRRFLC
jgi:hypothetical protein